MYIFTFTQPLLLWCCNKYFQGVLTVKALTDTSALLFIIQVTHLVEKKKHFYCWATVYISRKWKRANLFGDSEANKQMFDLGFTAIMHMQLLSPSFANVLCETKHCLLTRRSASFCLCSAADTDLCNFILYVIKWHNKPNEYFKGQFLIHFKRCVPVV